MRVKIKSDYPYRFVLRLPSATRGAGKRSTFRIDRRLYELSTRKVLETSTAELTEEQASSLERINQRFKEGKLDFEEAREELMNIVQQLYRTNGALRAVVFNTANLKVLSEYLDACYTETRRKKLASWDSARSEAARAIEILGDLSIQSASAQEIQDRVDQACLGDSSKQRRMIFKLRAILNWLRPSESWKHLLVPDAEEQKLVRYLSEDEYALVRNKLPTDLHKIFADLCFNLGCRIGEGVALGIGDLREARNVVLITKQITRAGHTARAVKPRTKNKKIRESFIFPEGISALKAWIKIKGQLTLEMRNDLADVLRKACQEVFPEDESKHLVWHDLRHCYAIRLLDRGLTIDDVADMIGDSVVVAKKHYTGFIVSDARMERIRSKVLAS